MAVGPGTDTGPGTAAAAAAAECSAALPAAAETESSAAVLRYRQAAYEKYPVLGFKKILRTDLSIKVTVE